MKLIYRANIFDYTPVPIPPYVKPRTLNWRFHPPGQKFECTPRPIQPYVKPRALNWRFKLPAMYFEQGQKEKNSSLSRLL